MPYFVRNADGDELYFIHTGRGQFETDYGVLSYEPGDYILLPKGTTYRIKVEPSPSLFLIIETSALMELPDRGLLGQHALFDLGVVSPPTLDPSGEAQGGREWEVRIKRAGVYTSVVYPFYPMDVVGWKGDLWVAKLNVRDFRPVMSARYHLPPSVHTTFQAGDVSCQPLHHDRWKAIPNPFGSPSITGTWTMTKYSSITRETSLAAPAYSPA